MSALPHNPDALLRKLEWTVIRRLDGVLHGDYRSLFRGFGLDLADLREYQLHDDVRHIDWNVTARMQSPYVREFNEEREVTAWFLLDLSPSVDFGSEALKKRAVSIEFVTVLARLLTRHGNRVGAVFYGENVDAVIPPRASRLHVLHMLQRILSRPELPRSGATDLAAFMRSAYELIPGARSCSWSPISSATPPGTNHSRTSPGATRCWPYGSTTPWRWSSRTSVSW
jgi:uncharacterized protein (DUF58 family)